MADEMAQPSVFNSSIDDDGSRTILMSQTINQSGEGLRTTLNDPSITLPTNISQAMRGGPGSSIKTPAETLLDSVTSAGPSADI